jgi:anti-anti-sigma factor
VSSFELVQTFSFHRHREPRMTDFVAEVRPDAPYVVRVSGDVDIATVGEFLTQARVALANATTGVEIDLGEVTFIDSTGLGALVRLRAEAKASGKDLQLVHVPGQVSRLLDLTGLSEILRVRREE